MRCRLEEPFGGRKGKIRGGRCRFLTSQGGWTCRRYRHSGAERGECACLEHTDVKR